MPAFLAFSRFNARAPSTRALPCLPAGGAGSSPGRGQIIDVVGNVIAIDGGTGTSQADTAGSGKTLSPADLRLLRDARKALENPGLAVKLASAMGTPIEKLLGRLPGAANRFVNEATGKALQTCLTFAIRSLHSKESAIGNAALQNTAAGEASAGAGGLAAEDTPYGMGNTGGIAGSLSTRPPELPGKPAKVAGRYSRRLHQLAVAATGAAGGAFGMASLPVELPITTTLMFRSIGTIAAQYGEDVQSPEAQLQCLTVLAMGGPTASDDDAAYGYFMVRGAMAQQVAAASAELAARGAGGHGSALVTKLLHTVAARFSAQVSEQAAAKSVPVIGAVFGAAVNTIFITHFQQMAQAHFTVRALERRYGEAAVRLAYSQVGALAGE